MADLEYVYNTIGSNAYPNLWKEYPSSEGYELKPSLMRRINGKQITELWKDNIHIKDFICKY